MTNFRNKKCNAKGCRTSTSAFSAFCEPCRKLHEEAAARFPLPHVDPHPASGLGHDAWKSMTPEQEQALVAADQPYNEQMKRRCEEANRLKHEALLHLIAAYGLGHPVVSAVRNAPSFWNPNSSRGADQVRWMRDEREKAQRQRQVTERELEKARKAERARAYLRANDADASGSDDEVLDRADELASEKRIEEDRQEREYRRFDGRNACKESCRGWDGRSYRCECGAHRVCYYTHGDFEKGYISTGIC